MELTEIQQSLLKDLTDLHALPQGAFSLRVNGETALTNSTSEIEIIPHKNKKGFKVVVKAGTKGKSLHIPVLIDQTTTEEVCNDFEIGDDCEILIVAGCGIHSSSNKSSQHNGVHSFKVGKNCVVRYVERHLGLGEKGEKILSPTTNITLGKNSTFEIETTQIGGVTSSNRITNAEVLENAKLVVKEKVLTDAADTANTNFVVNLNGKNSRSEIVSRSVAKGKSLQHFESTLIGNNVCFGRVECDGIVLGNAKVSSLPKIVANCAEAELFHEAQIGKIAGSQLLKLMTLGLSKEEAENKIIAGYLTSK